MDNQYIKMILILAYYLSFYCYAFVTNETKQFHERMLRSGEKLYDRRLRPFAGEKALEVEIFLHVLSLRSVSEDTMDYKIELYFREFWQDPRLSYDPMEYNNISNISLHESLVDELWTPDTYLPNAIKSENPDSRSITHRSLIRVEPDGHILYSRRLSVTAECPMDLSKYPFDNQVCVLSIESYGHPVSEVIYAWRKTIPVTRDPHLELPDFTLINVRTEERNVTLFTGTYTRLECCFFLKRNAGFHFVQLFLPATAIVVISWLLLYMDRTSKFSDMIEVILAITLLYYSYITLMPRVSYIKAMDIYLGSCFIFVFVSLIKLYTLKMYRRNNSALVASSAQTPCRLANIDDDDEEEENLDDYTQRGRKRVSKDSNNGRQNENSSIYFHPRNGGGGGGILKNDIIHCDNLNSQKEIGLSANKRQCWWDQLVNACKCAGHWLSRALVIYPIVFVCFSVMYFAFYLVLAKDDSEQKCIFHS